MTTAEHLDQAFLDELRQLMEDDFGVLLSTYLSESEKQLQALEASWHCRAFERLHRDAHKLKGSCSNIGAAQLADYCLEVETNARNERDEPIEAVLPSLLHEFAAVRAEIQTVYERL